MGSVRHLFITEGGGINILENQLITSSGQRIDIPSLRFVVSFFNNRALRCLKVPTAIIGGEGVELLNVPCAHQEEEDYTFCIYELLERSFPVARKVAPTLVINNPSVLLGWCLFQKQLFYTLNASLFMFSLEHVRPRVDLSHPVNLGCIEVSLLDLIFLPISSYLCLREVENILSHEIEPYREPKECVHLVLSYILGSYRLPLALKGCWSILLRNNLFEPNRPKAHGGFSTHTGELREPY